MQITDYEPAFALWTATEGMSLTVADSREGILRLLDRNQGLSAVAEREGRLVGTALASTDGRRGFIYHLAVERQIRGEGLGRQLVHWVMDRFRELGLARCNVLIFAQNEQGRQFWRHLGFRERPDLVIGSIDL
jgi:GNAT superfamily N-acetyltransferase